MALLDLALDRHMDSVAVETVFRIHTPPRTASLIPSSPVAKVSAKHAEQDYPGQLLMGDVFRPPGIHDEIYGIRQFVDIEEFRTASVSSSSLVSKHARQFPDQLLMSNVFTPSGIHDEIYGIRQFVDISCCSTRRRRRSCGDDDNDCSFLTTSSVKRRLFPISRTLPVSRSLVPTIKQMHWFSPSETPSSRGFSALAPATLQNVDWPGVVKNLNKDSSSERPSSIRSLSCGTVEIHPELRFSSNQLLGNYHKQLSTAASQGRLDGPPTLGQTTKKKCARRKCEACSKKKESGTPSRRYSEESLRFVSDELAYSKPRKFREETLSKKKRERSMSLEDSSFEKKKRPMQKLKKQVAKLPRVPLLMDTTTKLSAVTQRQAQYLKPTDMKSLGSPMGLFMSDFITTADSAGLNAEKTSCREIQKENFSLVDSANTFHDDERSPFTKLTSHLSAIAFNESSQTPSDLSLQDEKVSILEPLHDGNHGRFRDAHSSSPNMVDRRVVPAPGGGFLCSNNSPVFVHRDITSGRYFPIIEPVRAQADYKSSNGDSGNPLMLKFTEEIDAGIYSTEIKASVPIPGPDADGWREIIIASLPKPQGADISGSVSFVIGSIASDSNGLDMPPLTDPQSISACFPQAQFDTTNDLLDVQSHDSAQMKGKFSLQGPLKIRLRLKAPVYEIQEWNCSTNLSVLPTWSKDEGMQIKYHASVTMEVAKKCEIFAERVTYSFFIKNGCSKSRLKRFDLGNGECTIHLNDADHLDELLEDHVEIVIVRDVRDAQNPLEIYFTEKYQGKSSITVPLPTIYPSLGETVSENILLGKAPFPLTADYVLQDMFNTWKCIDISQDPSWKSRFERMEVPRLIPQGLKDDIILNIRELNPVRFDATKTPDDLLVTEEPTDFVRNMQVKIDRVLGKDLECQMNFDVYVSGNERVLTMSAQGWIPELFIINDRIATESVGEWRLDEDENMTLFKLAEMTAGQMVRIETRWKEASGLDEVKDDGEGRIRAEYRLPEIVGKTVIGGSLQCRVDGGVFETPLLPKL